MMKRHALGIHLTDGALHAARVQLPGGELRWYRKVALPGFLVAGLKDDEQVSRLREGLQRLRKSERVGRFDAVRVTIPDPVIHTRVFELKGLPAGRRERCDVARMNFAKELHRDIDTLACAVQYLGDAGGSKRLLAQAADAGWLAGISRACANGHLPLQYLNTASVSLFNLHYETLHQQQSAGAMVHLGDRHWGVVGWDGETILQFAHGRWLEEVSQTDGIVTELMRALRAYTRSFGGHLGMVFVLGEGGTASDLQQQLSSHIAADKLKLLPSPRVLQGQKGCGAVAAYAAALSGSPAL